MSMFSDYVTSCAFHLNLSRQMAQTMWLIDKQERGGGDRDRITTVFEAASDNFIAAAKALSRRGLVEWHEPPVKKDGYRDFSKPAHTLTQPGKLVLDLCVIAGVVPARWSNKVVQLKPVAKKRRAA